MSNELEIWKDIDGYEGLYQISSYGRVRSLARTVKSRWGTPKQIRAKILSPIKQSTGYISYNLCKDGIHYQKLAHRLVAVAFIPNPENKAEVNHKKGIRDDNRVSELEWATSSENQIHSYQTGLQIIKKGKESHKYGKVGVLNANSKLVLDSNTGIFYESASLAAKARGFSFAKTNRVLNNKNKTPNTTGLIYV